MRIYIAALKKEWLLLKNDKLGLLLMFVMPLILVFILTFVQDLAQKNASENRIKLLVNALDHSSKSKEFIDLIEHSKSFRVTVIKGTVSPETLNKRMMDEDYMLGLNIPKNFGNQITKDAKSISSTILSSFDLQEKDDETARKSEFELAVIYNPKLQQAHRDALERGFNSFIQLLENKTMMEQMYLELGYEKIPSEVQEKLFSKQAQISFVPAAITNSGKEPNATQHSIPAWTIFAMFFMVVSLGGNIVRERLNGSFIRLLTIPNSYQIVLICKLLLFVIVALVQMSVIFSIGIFVFPTIDLPPLELPTNVLALVTISLLTCLCAVSYSICVGMIARTSDQANGFGAVSIILFAAIGGIWIPQFAMPPFMHTVAMISPLNWCLEGFYNLFLYNGDWSTLMPIVYYQIVFILVCSAISFRRLTKITSGEL